LKSGLTADLSSVEVADTDGWRPIEDGLLQ
jgi:hypothetical protein